VITLMPVEQRNERTGVEEETTGHGAPIGATTT
jgi:hypothetical protein